MALEADHLGCDAGPACDVGAPKFVDALEAVFAGVGILVASHVVAAPPDDCVAANKDTAKLVADLRKPTDFCEAATVHLT